MDQYYLKLQNFISANGIACEHPYFAQSCHSVEDAMASTGASREDFVKNALMLDSDGNVVTCIVKGEDRASREAVAEVLGGKRPRIASPAQMLEKTDYPAGGTPSFGYSAKSLIDPRVLERPFVWTGGGSTDSLVKIAPQEMLRANGGTVAKVRA
ncbi:YbaK/EbsC family protein [Candidatus Micrarchaeota archaeon]|nr:YbaK/EbsC family protein [Candidatus Micrarchaeota archaeon]